MSDESDKVDSISQPNKSSTGKGVINGGGGGGGTGTTDTRACAACKYQRRRCTPDCSLAPYFPADNQQQFLNAHKLFGLRNFSKVLKNVEPPRKEIAIKTMIFQANVRASDPVGGCHRMVQELKNQINFCKAEMDLVLQQLALCRAQAVDTINNGGGSNGEENGSNSIDDALNFCNSINFPPGFEYNGHNDNDDVVFDEIPDRTSEDVKPPVVDGSSCSDQVILPKAEAEADKSQAKQETDLKSAASQFSLRN